MKSKCTSWRGKAPVRPRCQGRGVGVHRSEAESLDRRSGRIRRRIWPGRAANAVPSGEKLLELYFAPKAIQGEAESRGAPIHAPKLSAATLSSFLISHYPPTHLPAR